MIRYAVAVSLLWVSRLYLYLGQLFVSCGMFWISLSGRVQDESESVAARLREPRD